MRSNNKLFIIHIKNKLARHEDVEKGSLYNVRDRGTVEWNGDELNGFLVI